MKTVSGTCDAASSTAILVLGMHRSGTSALAGALQRLGVSLSEDLVTAAPDNPGGYFEHAGAVTLDDALLAALGRGWEDLRALPPDWVDSDAATLAEEAILALLRRDFGNAPLWALKDPRLCRLLPLWQRALGRMGIQPAYVMVLRHPDEVAASLASRDGIGGNHADLLWLQHVLDAERDSRGGRRAIIRYEELLAEPAGVLVDVGKQLGIEWPKAPASALLGDLLDARERHHHADATSAPAGPRRLAMTLYQQMHGDPEPAFLDHAARQVQRWTNRLAPWLDGLATSLTRARRLHADALSRVGHTDEALDAAKALSVSRLQELEQVHQRLAGTDEALDQVKALSVSRLQELTQLHQRLETTDEALEQVKGLSVARLQELEQLHVRLADTDEALDQVKALSVSRLQELEQLHARLEITDEALEQVKGLSVARLQELAQLHERLSITDTALAEAQALSVARLGELAELDSRLRLTDAALAKITALSLQRLDEMIAADARADEANARAHDANTRAEQAVATMQETRVRDAAALDAMATREASIRAELQALMASRSWRYTRPMRALMRMLGRDRGSPSA